MDLSVFRFDTALENLPYLIVGVAWTLAISTCGIALGSAIGITIALLRLLKNTALNAAAIVIVNFFQSTPLLVQLLWLYFALPILLGTSISSFAAGIIGLGLYSGAYLSEVFRAGILAVESGQWQAGRALGMRPTMLLRKIVLPQGIPMVLPPVANIFISTIKESALVSAIGVEDLMYRAYSLSALNFRPVETLTIAAILYFTIIYPLVLLSNGMHRRFVKR